MSGSYTHMGSLSRAVFLLGAAVLVVSSERGFAQQRIGDTHRLDSLATPSPYEPPAVAGGISWTTTLRHPGATMIKLHFTKFDIADGDYVVVRDPASTQFVDYFADQPTDFWAGAIFGDEVVVELFSVSGTSGRGFVITEYAESALNPVCNNLCEVDVECSPPNGTPVYPQRMPVCALVYVYGQGVYACSCWQFALRSDGPGFILTNQHCTPEGGLADPDWGKIEAWFNAERVLCGTGGLKTITNYRLDAVCCSDCKTPTPSPGTGCGQCQLRSPTAPPDPQLDYFVFLTNPFGAALPPSHWGTLAMRNGPPVANEGVYRYHHADGCQKQYSAGVIVGPSGNVPQYYDYTALGGPGSSGSPTIAAADGCVVAHHGYGSSPPDENGCTEGKGSAAQAVLLDILANDCLPPDAILPAFCPPLPENCCYPVVGGSCGMVPGGTCEPTGGIIVTTCEGDADGSGIDDACEVTCCEPVPGGSCGSVPIGGCPPGAGVRVAACQGDNNGNNIDDACEPTEICCIPIAGGACGSVPVGTCPGVVVPACLNDSNNTWIDDACEPPMGLCCDPLGACVAMPPALCTATGGNPVPACLGDANLNNRDDVCESPTLELENCCVPAAGGFCGPVLVGTCAPLYSGTVVPVCRGDANGNSIDDACDAGGLETCCYPFPGGGCATVPSGTCVLGGGQVVPGCVGDNNGNGIDDACDLVPCFTNVDCAAVDNDVCTCDNCHVGLGFCFFDPIEYGNVNCAGPAAPNLDDILCVLAGFGNYAACVNADIAPPCTGNNIINLDDILAVLAAFAGADPCGCP